MMKLLFSMMVDVRKEERRKVSSLKELEFRVSELQEMVVEKEAALEAQQLDFDRKRLAMEAKHSDVMDWLFHITCNVVDVKRPYTLFVVPSASALLARLEFV